MHAGELSEELAKFDASVALDAATTPPASWYQQSAFYELERRTAFRNNWLYACRAEQVAKPNAFVALALAEQPLLVLRNGDGELRALHNVCRHHAAEICAGSGSVERLVCPYHGWTYDLDGRLLKAPELGAARDFEREHFALPRAEVGELGPFVFVSPTACRRTLAGDFGALHARLAATGYESLRFYRRVEYELECNWKVFVDNYLDGGYHVERLHHGLAGELDLGTYRTELFELYSIQASGGASERIGATALYAWLYPNVMLNRYGPVLDTNLVLPLSPSRTRVVIDYYFDAATLASPELIANALNASDRVQREDVAICESVQRGLRSGSYDRGRYSVTREAPMHHFHRLLAADLASGRTR
jgi:choline monooxygenase